MRSHKILPLLGWLVAGGLICFAAMSLKLGKLQNPRPGMFPFLIGGMIVLLSCVGIAKEWFSKEETPDFSKIWPDMGGLTRVLWIFGLLLFYMIFLKSLGFFLCTLIFFGTILKIVERKRWEYTILTSLAAAALAYVLFHVLLNINLPEGILTL